MTENENETKEVMVKAETIILTPTTDFVMMVGNSDGGTLVMTTLREVFALGRAFEADEDDRALELVQGDCPAIMEVINRKVEDEEIEPQDFYNTLIDFISDCDLVNAQEQTLMFEHGDQFSCPECGNEQIYDEEDEAEQTECVYCDHIILASEVK